MTTTNEFSVVIERDEDGYYVASVPALPGCHTQATSLDELMVRVKEAIELCLEVEEDRLTFCCNPIASCYAVCNGRTDCVS